MLWSFVVEMKGLPEKVRDFTRGLSSTGIIRFLSTMVGDEASASLTLFELR